jgi:hypothetical protein
MRRGTAVCGRGFRRILIPTDGSLLSKKAARAGIAFAAAVSCCGRRTQKARSGVGPLSRG